LTDDVHDDNSPLAGTEIHYLQSAAVGDEFKIFVGHCGDTGEQPAAVLYLTDANGQFGAAVDVVRSLQLDQHLPPMLIVGIGYRMGGIIDTIAIRTRDLTPTVDDDYARLVPAQSEMGGAPRLLQFIRTELMPWVAERYNVDAAGAAYFGHSLGGLFGCYVLLHASDTFGRYAISSPSLWWHFDAMFDMEAAYAGAHDDLPARVFFAIGAFEDEAGRHREVERLSAEIQALARARPIDMVADTLRMVERLDSRGYPSLELESIVFPEEFHITVWPLSLSRALRHLFDAPM